VRLLPSASFFWVPPVRIILRPMLSLVYLSASCEHRHFERAKERMELVSSLVGSDRVVIGTELRWGGRRTTQ
jgi:hypothetical protein